MKSGWLCLLVVTACGGSDAAPDATVVIPDAGPCTTETEVADDVMEIGIDQDAPIPAGGTLEDGTYALTAAVYYTGVGGQAGETGVVYHATSVNEGGEYQYIDSGTNAANTTGVYQTSGTDEISVVQQCPNLAPLGFDKYTATPDEFQLFSTTDGPPIQVLTFTRQTP